MYVEKINSGQYKYVERYKDPMTLAYKRVCITLDKNDRKTRKLAENILKDKINHALCTSDVSYLTFSELIEKYLTFQKNNVKLSTYTRNKGCCNTLKKMIGSDTIVSNLNARYIRECLDKSGNANSTKNEWLKRLKALIRWGYKNDYIENISYLDKLNNYVDNSRKLKAEDKYLEEDEIAKLLKSIRSTNCTHWIDLTEFLLLSGLRIGEAIALQKKDIQGNIIMVSKTYDYNNCVVNDTPKTDAGNREVFIQDELTGVIKRIKLHNRLKKVSSTLLFSVNGSYVSYDNYRIFLQRHSMKSIGRKITPHALRHTHASLLFANGLTIDTVSRRLGHANSDVTREIYIHIMEKLKERDKENLRHLKLI